MLAVWPERKGPIIISVLSTGGSCFPAAGEDLVLGFCGRCKHDANMGEKLAEGHSATPKKSCLQLQWLDKIPDTCGGGFLVFFFISVWDISLCRASSCPNRRGQIYIRFG